MAFILILVFGALGYLTFLHFQVGWEARWRHNELASFPWITPTSWTGRLQRAC